MVYQEIRLFFDYRASNDSLVLIVMIVMMVVMVMSWL